MCYSEWQSSNPTKTVARGHDLGYLLWDRMKMSLPTHLFSGFT